MKKRSLRVNALLYAIRAVMSFVFPFITDSGIYNDDTFPQKIQPIASMDPIMHKHSRQHGKTSFHAT